MVQVIETAEADDLRGDFAQLLRTEATRLGAVAQARAAIEEAGFLVLGEADSEVPGPKGNVERFVWARRLDAPAPPKARPTEAAT